MTHGDPGLKNNYLLGNDLNAKAKGNDYEWSLFSSITT